MTQFQQVQGGDGVSSFWKSSPTPGDVHVNRPLTNISIAFLQRADSFVADQVFPNIPVDKQSDLYFVYDRGMFNRDQMQKRAPGSEAKKIDYNVDAPSNSYFADVWALAHDIPDQRRANADEPLQPDREAVELLSHQAMIKREVTWAATFFASGSAWTRKVTGVASAPSASQTIKWDLAGSSPVEDVEKEKALIAESTGFEPNVLVLSRHVWRILRNHPDIVDRIKYGQTAPGSAVVSLATVAQVFELDQILVSRAIQNTAAEGIANVHSFIAGKNALLAYSSRTPGIMTPSAGYTFSWRGLLGAGPAGQRLKRFRMEWLEADRVEMEMAYAQKMVSADLGTLFVGIVS